MQEFNIWNFIAHPREITYDITRPRTRAIWIANVQKHLPVLVWQETTKYFPLVSMKLALLAHYPSTNAATQALLSLAIPPRDTAMNEIRYMAALKEEIQRTYATLPSQIPTWADEEIALHPDGVQGILWTFVGGEPVRQWMLANHHRAKKIVDWMAYFDMHSMTALAADTTFIRNAARVRLGETGGFTLTAGAQNLLLTTRPANIQSTYTAGSAVDMTRVRIEQAAGTTTGTATVVSKNAPIKMSLPLLSPETINRNATRQITAEEITGGVELTVIEPPQPLADIPNQTVPVGVEQTVSYPAFLGDGITYTVSSSAETIATVRKSQDANILVVTGISQGNATITLTGTNVAGSAASTFTLTVTSATGD